MVVLAVPAVPVARTAAAEPLAHLADQLLLSGHVRGRGAALRHVAEGVAQRPQLDACLGRDLPGDAIRLPGLLPGRRGEALGTLQDSLRQ